MSYHGRRDDPPIQIVLRDWGGWRRSYGQAVGCGSAALDAEKIGFVRSPGTHSDPVFAEYVASQEAGQGVYRFIDRRLAEHYAIVKRIMIARYVVSAQWDVIAHEVQSNVAEARLLHDRCCGNMDDAVRAYLASGDDHGALAIYSVLYRVRESRRAKRPKPATLRDSVS